MERKRTLTLCTLVLAIVVLAPTCSQLHWPRGRATQVASPPGLVHYEWKDGLGEQEEVLTALGDPPQREHKGSGSVGGIGELLHVEALPVGSEGLAGYGVWGLEREVLEGLGRMNDYHGTPDGQLAVGWPTSRLGPAGLSGYWPSPAGGRSAGFDGGMGLLTWTPPAGPGPWGYTGLQGTGGSGGGGGYRPAATLTAAPAPMVPEPHALALLGVGSLLVLARRRRHRGQAA